MTIESIIYGHFFIYLLLNIMLKLFKTHKKLRWILLWILGYWFVNFLFMFMVTYLIEVNWDEYTSCSEVTWWKFLLCVLQSTLSKYVWWNFFSPLNRFIGFIVLWSAFFVLTQSIFSWWAIKLDEKSFYLLALVGVTIVVLICWIYIWLRKLFKKKK